MRMEVLILAALKWRLRSITPFSFIDFFAYKLDSSGAFIRFLISRATEIILATLSGTIDTLNTCICISLYLYFNYTIKKIHFSHPSVLFEIWRPLLIWYSDWYLGLLAIVRGCCCHTSRGWCNPQSLACQSWKRSVMVCWLEQCKEVINDLWLWVCVKKKKKMEWTMPTGEPMAFAGEDRKLLSIDARCRS